MPEQGIWPQSTGLQTYDVGDRRHTPPSRPQINFGLAPDRPCHANDRARAGIVSDQRVGLMIVDDTDPRTIQIEIIEHPRIGALDIAETGHMLEPSARQPANPPLVAFFSEDDKPVFRLTLRQADSAAFIFRTHRAASISFEP